MLSEVIWSAFTLHLLFVVMHPRVQQAQMSISIVTSLIASLIKHLLTDWLDAPLTRSFPVDDCSLVEVKKQIGNGL